MAYPSRGLKKPLNMFEGPIYPDIKKGPPRFQWSGKHWTVDPAVMRDTEHITQFYEPAVLAQSRDYNKTVYGQSSHKDIVNAAFRPPLIDPIEDIYPLTRIPATSKTIVPRVNPATAFSTGGTSGYTAKNERVNNIEKHLTDRVTSGNWRPTFFAPIDVPMDNSVLPDLEMTIPSISASAGHIFPSFDAPTPEVHLDYEQITPLLDPGKTTNVCLDGSSGLEETKLYDNRPQGSVDAGMNTPIQIGGQIAETQLDLRCNRPQGSTDAGMNTPIQIDGPQQTEIPLKSQIDTPISVINPGAEDNFKYRMSPDRDPQEYIKESYPRYSYVVPATSPAYRTQNELTYKPHFKEKLQPLKHHGKITNSSAIPRIGLDQPQFSLKNRSEATGMQRKAIYRF